MDVTTDYNLMDPQPIKSGYGRIWQGGYIISPYDLSNIPSPVAIIAMNPDHEDLKLIDHRKFFIVLHVGIDDYSDCIIPDEVLLGLVDACIALLKNGINLYIHCFTEDMLVGSNVPMQIKFIQNGDTITSHDGTFNTVLETTKNEYCGEIITIKSRGTLPITCTPEHPFLIHRPYRYPSGRKMKLNWLATPKLTNQHDTMWVRAKNIQIGDFLLSPKQTQQDSIIIPEWINTSTHLNHKQLNRLTNTDNDFAWLCGVYIAGGATPGKNGIQFSLSLHDDIDRIESILTRLGVHVVIKKYDNYYRVTAASRTLCASFKEWFGSNSYNKHIPEFLYHGWNLDSVLSGILDGDGHYSSSRKCHTLSTTSRVLAQQVWQLAVDRGMYPYLRENKIGSWYDNASKSWSVEWRVCSQHCTAYLDNYYCLPVKDVTTSNFSGQVYNMEVSVKHTYNINGVAVHNCMAGISRSTYLDAAIHMRLLDKSYDDVFELLLQMRCPIGPNKGFTEHLKRLEPRLRMENTE